MGRIRQNLELIRLLVEDDREVKTIHPKSVTLQM